MSPLETQPLVHTVLRCRTSLPLRNGFRFLPQPGTEWYTRHITGKELKICHFLQGRSQDFTFCPRLHVCTGRIRQLGNKNDLLSETGHSTPSSTQQHYLQKTDEAESCCLLKFSNSYYRKIDICHVKETESNGTCLEKKHIQKRHSSICLISLQISHSVEFKCMLPQTCSQNRATGHTYKILSYL